MSDTPKNVAWLGYKKMRQLTKKNHSGDVLIDTPCGPWHLTMEDGAVASSVQMEGRRDVRWLKQAAYLQELAELLDRDDEEVAQWLPSERAALGRRINHAILRTAQVVQVPGFNSIGAKTTYFGPAGDYHGAPRPVTVAFETHRDNVAEGVQEAVVPRAIGVRGNNKEGQCDTVQAAADAGKKAAEVSRVAWHHMGEPQPDSTGRIMAPEDAPTTLFVTLTTPPLSSLEEAYDVVTASWRRFAADPKGVIKRGTPQGAKVQAVYKGIEMTARPDGTWHVHVHALVLMNRRLEGYDVATEYDLQAEHDQRANLLARLRPQRRYTAPSRSAAAKDAHDGDGPSATVSADTVGSVARLTGLPVSEVQAQADVLSRDDFWAWAANQPTAPRKKAGLPEVVQWAKDAAESWQRAVGAVTEKITGTALEPLVSAQDVRVVTTMDGVGEYVSKASMAFEMTNGMKKRGLATGNLGVGQLMIAAMTTGDPVRVMQLAEWYCWRTSKRRSITAWSRGARHPNRWCPVAFAGEDAEGNPYTLPERLPVGSFEVEPATDVAPIEIGHITPGQITMLCRSAHYTGLHVDLPGIHHRPDGLHADAWMIGHLEDGAFDPDRIERHQRLFDWLLPLGTGPSRLSRAARLDVLWTALEATPPDLDAWLHAVSGHLTALDTRERIRLEREAEDNALWGMGDD